jgi:glycosyltransferase involved in cell wall biosynthesis
MTKIALSIIVPIYNVEDYLDDCLSSIYDLSGLNYEVILVNDGSPDNSVAIIDRFQQQYPNNTVVINRENGGLSAARNSGLEVAKGDYIALIDSDDYISSQALLELFQNAIKDNLDIAIAQSLTFWGARNSPTQQLTIPERVLQLPPTSGLNFLETSFNAKYKRVNCWNKLYKRSFIEQHQLTFIEKLLFEDVPFTFEAFFAAAKVRAFPLDYYYYRQRPGSIMTSSNQKADPSRITIVNHVLKLFNQYQYQDKAFDDYLVYQLWENACGSKQKHVKLCFTFLKRGKVSYRGFIRLLSIMTGLPKLLSE